MGKLFDKIIFFSFVLLMLSSFYVITMYKAEIDNLKFENKVLNNENKSKDEHYKVLIEENFKNLEKKIKDSFLLDETYLKNQISLYTKGKIKIKRKVNPKHLYLMIKESSKYTYGTDVFLKLVRYESNFNKDAKSPVGARGYCQLMPPTYNQYRKKLHLNKSNYYENNIIIGAYYFNELYVYWDKKLGNKHNKDTILKYTIASWNAGIGTVIRHKGIPNYKETKGLIASVMK